MVIEAVTRDGMFDLALFQGLIDLFNHLPVSAKDIGEGADSNVSKNMHMILSSNM
jgi:hypothetical protein